ncbi:MAG: rhodanese-like domain-containing protein [Dehalococcoidia bacterium]|nr:rhodanese-like domain-containing protein [Dehalococcoidia bacterium]
MPRRERGEPFYRINVDEAVKMYGKPDVVVVDVRNPDEYKSGHVKGAILMPVDEVLARVDELPKDKKVLFICMAGSRSALAAEMAAAMGLDTENLYNIEDGTPAWLQKKLPSSTGMNP